MKRTILLTLLVVSTAVLSSSSKKSEAEPQQMSFNKTATGFKRDLGSAD